MIPQKGNAAPAKYYYVVENKSGHSWQKGSEAGLLIVVKHSTDDSETFARFLGVEVDGAAIRGWDRE